MDRRTFMLTATSAAAAAAAPYRADSQSIMSAGHATADVVPPADPRVPGDGPGRVLTPGPIGWWDSERVSCPRVLREQGGEWRMWYYGRDPRFNRAIGLPSGRSGLATSRDGIHWQRVRGPLTMGSVLEPSAVPERFDSGHVGITDVHHDHDGYTAWYLGGSRIPGNMGGRSAVGFPLRPGRARSRDGLHWNKFDGAYAGALMDVGASDSYDPYLVGWPQVLREDDGSWKLYYQSLKPDEGFMTCLAVSQDGDRWDKVGPVFRRGPAGDFDENGPATRQVIRRGREYLMFYEAQDRARHFSIGLARSDDGLHWTRVRGPDAGGSILAHAPADSGRWDAGGVGTPWVVPNGQGGHYLYFVGANNPPVTAGQDGFRELALVHQIGLAVSEGDDFLQWKRWDSA